VKYKLNKSKSAESTKSKELVVGKAAVYLDGKVVQETPIYYQNTVKKKKGLFDFIKEIFLIAIGVNAHG